MTKLIVLSDLHTGSDYGLQPPKYHTKAGNEIGLNPYQKWLWEKWEDCWDWAKKVIGKDDWSVIINGDSIDGYHHGTKEIWSHDESEHGIAAYHILRDRLKGAKSVFITEGTESHTKDHEHLLAHNLKEYGVKIRKPEHGAAWKTLEIEIHGTLCKFDHHVSSTTRSYLESSAYAITLGNMRNERARAGQDVPRIIGRAHRHRYGAFDDGYGMMFVTPPWQLLTRFGRKVVPDAVPQVGMVILDWEGREENSIPDIRRRLHTFSNPSPQKI